MRLKVIYNRAFSLIEIIFVLIVVSILSYFLFPNVKKDELLEGTSQILGHINYTRHLAMMDNKFDPMEKSYKNSDGYLASNEGKYYKSRWQIRFYQTLTSGIWYAIYSDTDRRGNIDITNHQEPALDPLTGKYLFYRAGSNDPKLNSNMVLKDRFNITSVTSNCYNTVLDSSLVNNTRAALSFDHFGRPYKGISNNTNDPFSNILTNQCIITITHSSGREANITIEPETGYSYISSINLE